MTKLPSHFDRHPAPGLRLPTWRRAASGSPARRGGALLMALICATVAAAAAATLLQLSMQMNRRKLLAEHDARAFYLAEAGITEAYLGLQTGTTGSIGSQDEPAVFDDGMLWVEAEEQKDGNLMRLECTALSGLGRSTVAVVVERREEPLGFFADKDIKLDKAVLVDGYDSQEGPYEEQVTGGSLTVGSDYPFTHVDKKNRLLFYRGSFFRFYAGKKGEYHYDHSVSLQELADDPDYARYDIDANDFTDHEPGKKSPDYKDTEYEGVLEYFAEVPFAGEDSGGEGSGAPTRASTSDLGPTTGRDGQLGSNGTVVLKRNVAVFGDVVPGPEEDVSLQGGATVTGHMQPRRRAVELEPVRVPAVVTHSGVDHDGALPFVIPPSEIGYNSLRVRRGSELHVQGPSLVVVGELLLEDGAGLLVDNASGVVQLVVTEKLDLAEGSWFDVTSGDTSRLVLQAAGGIPVKLHADSAFYGLIYAPRATVSVKSPFEIFGAMLARNFKLGPKVRMHFDAGLTGSSDLIPRLISWQIAELPPAVRPRDIDPFEMLGVEPTELTKLEDAHESISWTLKATYRDLDGKKRSYKGPLEEHDPTQVSEYLKNKLWEPKAELEEPWLIYLEYTNKSGARKVYDGPIEGLPYKQVKYIHQRVVYPPGK